MTAHNGRVTKNLQLPIHEPLVAVVRSGHVESVHNGSAVILDESGDTMFAIGDPGAPMYPRSALKPLQGLAMLKLGYTGTPQEITLACASHSGEAVHLDTVAGMLSSADLSTQDLQNTPDLPIGVTAHRVAVEEKLAPTSLMQNCSGKHAAMLVTCKINGWDTSNYLDAQHPLQQAIALEVEAITGEKISGVAVDGCGAPLFYISLTGLARGFAHIANTARNSPQSHEATIFNSISNNPLYLAGSERDTTAMMEIVPGLMCKDGAESVHAGALADGRAFAVKIGDGSPRARLTATARILEMLGQDTADLLDRFETKVLGHGESVGGLKAVF